MPATDAAPPCSQARLGRVSARVVFLAAAFAALPAARAYPPAPPYNLHGQVRDSRGNPYADPSVAIVFYDLGLQEKARTFIDPAAGVGANYSLLVPMDSGITSELYEVSAMRPGLPFTLRVIVGGVSYLPIQMTTGSWTVGQPAERRRLDLTVGVDSDGDGLPDAWEWDLINSDSSGRLQTLADVLPGDDFDGDGMTNLQEYIAGTYAFDAADGLALNIVEVIGGVARLRFLAITGRTYTISSSTDLTTWTPQTFAFTPGGAERTSFLATDVRVLDVHAPMGAGARKFFRLHVE